MNEKDLKHNILIDISMYNSRGAFVPSAYQRMIMSMIEEHLDTLNMGEKRLMEELGISWVLLSTSIELKRRILPTDKLTGITWHAGGRIPSFRRDFTFIDESGETVAAGATVSTLFDNETRKICLDREKLSVVTVDAQDTVLENLERRMKIPAESELVEVRRVRPSMTDGVGHVNNTKYGDFVYDAMSPREREELHRISRIDVWFNSELREGDEFEIRKFESDGSALGFFGRRLGEQRSAFDMKITFNGENDAE